MAYKIAQDLKLSIENPHYQVVGGPSTFTMYITALYFCMTCMTSIGFGNVAADTDNEKVRLVKITALLNPNNYVSNKVPHS